MSTDDERCAQARKLDRIDDAFKRGDLDALRAAVDDPSLVPNGDLHEAIGSCLVHAIYLSPLAFIRTLLEIGADPNRPVDDGFPPLIAALTCTRAVPGSTPRTDVNEIVRLLLEHGVDPNQRGINDYTALHMAVAEGNALAVQILLDAGADPEIRTRIDDCERPLEMARAAHLPIIAGILERKGGPIGLRLHSGVTLIVDIPGDGEPVRRQHNYDVRLRCWLDPPPQELRRTSPPPQELRRTGPEPVRWRAASGPVDVARLEDDRRLLVTRLRIERRSLINGLFYGVDGMRVGGTRRLAIASHMAYGSRGVPGVIPPDAALTVEITVVAAA
jgi:hypothetical protein